MMNEKIEEKGNNGYKEHGWGEGGQGRWSVAFRAYAKRFEGGDIKDNSNSSLQGGWKNDEIDI